MDTEYSSFCFQRFYNSPMWVHTGMVDQPKGDALRILGLDGRLYVKSNKLVFNKSQCAGALKLFMTGRDPSHNTQGKSDFDDRPLQATLRWGFTASAFQFNKGDKAKEASQADLSDLSNVKKISNKAF